MDNYSIQKKLFLFIAILSIGIIGRIIPHPANVTPLLALTLFAAKQFNLKTASLSLCIILIISDTMLSGLYHYPLFGSWTLFSYSGFMLILLFSSLNPNAVKNHLIITVLASSLGYWLWTNLGTFLFSGLYSHTISDFYTCYSVALPFLRNSLIGNLIWTIIVFKVRIPQKCRFPLRGND